MSVYKILQELASDNSRLAKEKILKREINNDTLKRVFSAALNPYINYWIKEGDSVQGCDDDPINIESMFDTLNSLSSRKVTGNAARSLVNGTKSQLSNDDGQVFYMILNRDLRCGVSEATVNKIWPGLIPTFDVMLAHKDISGIKYPAYAQTKMDAMRVHVHYDGVKATVWTRAGKEIKLHNVLDTEAQILMDADDTVDGELIFRNKNGKFLDRKTSNGIGNKGVKGTISKEEASRAVVVVWDLVDFTGTIPYRDRLAKLNERLTRDSIQKVIGLSKFVPCYTEIVNSEQEADLFYKKMINQGEEGAILKNMDSMWQPKRSKDLGKMKAEEEADLVVKGVNPGSGKFEGMVGSLECETSDGECEVNVSGFTDDVRASLNEDIVGSIITVKYNQKIKDKKSGKWSLFLPRFVEFRTDKSVANSLDELK